MSGTYEKRGGTPADPHIEVYDSSPLVEEVMEYLEEYEIPQGLVDDVVKIIERHERDETRPCNTSH